MDDNLPLYSVGRTQIPYQDLPMYFPVSQAQLQSSLRATNMTVTGWAGQVVRNKRGSPVRVDYLPIVDSLSSKSTALASFQSNTSKLRHNQAVNNVAGSLPQNIPLPKLRMNGYCATPFKLAGLQRNNNAKQSFDTPMIRHESVSLFGPEQGMVKQQNLHENPALPLAKKICENHFGLDASNSKILASLFNHKTLMTLGQQLYLACLEIFQSIEESEWPAYCFSKSDQEKELKAPRVVLMLKMFNQIVQFVQRAILSLVERKKRTKIVQKFLRLAESSVQLGNFCGGMALFAAVLSTPVHKLKCIEGISKSSKERLTKLKEVFSSAKGNANLREEVKIRIDNKSPCIPFIGIIIGDVMKLGEFKSLLQTPEQKKTTELKINQMCSDMRQYQLGPRHSFQADTALQKAIKEEILDALPLAIADTEKLAKIKAEEVLLARGEALKSALGPKKHGAWLGVFRKLFE